MQKIIVFRNGITKDGFRELNRGTENLLNLENGRPLKSKL